MQNIEAREQPDPIARLRIVDEIVTVNPAATREFLAQFSTDRLRDYLDHLRSTDLPRGANSRWIRRGDSPAIVGRESL